VTLEPLGLTIWVINKNLVKKTSKLNLQAPQASIIWVVLEQTFFFWGESLPLEKPQKSLNVTHT
jgi:hypothetical protein